MEEENNNNFEVISSKTSNAISKTNKIVLEKQY